MEPLKYPLTKSLKVKVGNRKELYDAKPVGVTISTYIDMNGYIEVNREYLLDINDGWRFATVSESALDLYNTESE